MKILKNLITITAALAGIIGVLALILVVEDGGSQTVHTHIVLLEQYLDVVFCHDEYWAQASPFSGSF